MNCTVLLVLWQPGCCRWLLPFKGSHVCVGMRVLQAHAASVCKVAPRLQAHGFGFPLQLHTAFYIILTMLLLLKLLLLRRRLLPMWQYGLNCSTCAPPATNGPGSL